MRDRVAEVLAQRRTLDRGVGTGVAVAILLHAAIVGGAVWSALHQPPPQTANVLNIKFAPMPAVSAPIAPTKPAVVKPRTIQEPQAVIEKPKADIKPEPKTVPLSNFGQSTKKGSEHPAPPPPTPAALPSQTATAPHIAVGGT